MNYNEIDIKLQGRNRESRKYGNNTYLVRRNSHLALLYHSTEVVQYFADGRIVLDSGKWHTTITKERINWGLPADWVLWQEKGSWFVSKGYNAEERFFFQDGLTINADGTITGAGVYNPEAIKELKKQVKWYAEICTGAVPLNQPSGGDCWYCFFSTQEGQSLGDAIKDTDHIDSHIKGGYIVPSLVYNALKECYNAPMAFWQAFKDTGYTGEDREFGREAVRQAVYKYILKRKGLAGARLGHPRH